MLQRTEECDQERNGEIYTESMEDGNNDETLARTAGDNRQRGIHRRGTTHANGSQLAKILCQQGRTEQGDNFSADISQQGYRAQFRSTILRDEDTRQRVIPKSRTYRQTIRQLSVSQHQGSSGTSRQGSQDCHHRQQHQSGIHLPETLQYRSIATYADAHAEHQAAKRYITHVAIQQPGRNYIANAHDNAQHKEAHDNQATLHGLPPFFHNAQAKSTLPALPPSVNTTASRPKV